MFSIKPKVIGWVGKKKENNHELCLIIFRIYSSSNKFTIYLPTLFNYEHHKSSYNSHSKHGVWENQMCQVNLLQWFMFRKKNDFWVPDSNLKTDLNG